MGIPGCYNPAQPKIVRRFHAIEHVTKTHWGMCKKPKVWLNFVANRLGLIKKCFAKKKLVAQIRWYGQGISLHISWGRWIIFGVESATWHVCSFWLKHWEWPTKNPDVYRSLRLQCRPHKRGLLGGIETKAWKWLWPQWECESQWWFIQGQQKTSMISRFQTVCFCINSFLQLWLVR